VAIAHGKSKGEWNLLPDDCPETALRFSTGRLRNRKRSPSGGGYGPHPTRHV